jgi:hypothetical protein
MATAVALAVAGCGGRAGVSGQSGASLLRADTLAFVSIDSDLGSAQWQQTDELLKKFPARAKLLAYLRGELKKNGLTYEDDLAPALGPEVDVAVGDVPASPAFAVMTKPDDADKLKALVAKLNKDESRPAVYREVNGWYLVSQSQAMIDRLLKSGSESSLADEHAFTDAMNEVAGDGLVKAYVNGAQLGRALSAIPSGGAAASGLGLDKLEFLAATLTAESDGVRLSGAGKGEGIQKLPGGGSFAPKLVADIPAGALAVLDFRGGELGSGALQSLRSNPLFQQGLQQLEQKLGVTLDEVLALFRGEVAFYVRPGAPIPELTLVTESSDEQQAFAIVDKLVTHIAALTHAQVSFSTTQQDGVSVKTADFGRFTIQYAAFAGKLVVTSGPSGIRDLRSSGDKLPGDPVYKDARNAAGAPGETSGFLYVNLQDSIRLIAAFLGTRGTNVPSDLQPNLEPLRSLFAYATAEGNVGKLTAFLQLK